MLSALFQQAYDYLTGEGWFVTAIAVLIFLDFVGRVLKGEYRKIDHKEAISSFAIGGIYLFVGVSGAAIVGEPIAALAYEYRFWDLPNVWWTSVLALVMAEFTYYWGHRWLHTVRLFWCIHMVHHSARDLSVATAVKMPVLEPLFMALGFVWFLPFFGFNTVDALFAAGFNFVFGAFHHTTVIPKLGGLDKFIPFVTPAQHRVHHGCDLKYLDTNYGGTLIIWDWIFGTFQDEEEEPTYGLTKNIDSYNPIYLQTVGFEKLWHDVKNARSLGEALKYMFYPPGWSPDGSTLTTKQKRKLLNEQDSLPLIQSKAA